MYIEQQLREHNHLKWASHVTEMSYVIVYFNMMYGTFMVVFESKTLYILKNFVKNIQKYTDLSYIYTM